MPHVFCELCWIGVVEFLPQRKRTACVFFGSRFQAHHQRHKSTITHPQTRVCLFLPSFLQTLSRYHLSKKSLSWIGSCTHPPNPPIHNMRHKHFRIAVVTQNGTSAQAAQHTFAHIVFLLQPLPRSDSSFTSWFNLVTTSTWAAKLAGICKYM
mgnify:CR=1 FL=1